MSLLSILVQALETAQAEAQHEAERSKQLSTLMSRLDDQGTMILELSEQVKQLVARYDQLAKPPTLQPPPPEAAPHRGNGAPVKRLPRPSNIDYDTLLDQYLADKVTTLDDLAKQAGTYKEAVGAGIRAAAERRGSNTVTAYRRRTQEKRIHWLQAKAQQTKAQLNRTTPPGTGGLSTIPIADVPR